MVWSLFLAYKFLYNDTGTYRVSFEHDNLTEDICGWRRNHSVVNYR